MAIVFIQYFAIEQWEYALEHRYVAKMDSKCYLILNQPSNKLPKTLNVSPKQGNFAKSGHTA